MAQTKIPKGFGKFFTKAHGLLYKLTKGKVGGTMQGGTIGLLTTIGRKSGKERTVPLILLPDGDAWIVAASYSGHDEHPAWYLNLQAKNEATVQIGDDSMPGTSTQLEGSERTEAWAKLVSLYADYDEYQKVTDREIPVLRLTKT